MRDSGKSRFASLMAAASIAALGMGMSPVAGQGGTVVKSSSVTNGQSKQAPASVPGVAQERFLDSFWSRRTRAPRGKRVRHSVAQDRRIAKKVRNVKRSKR